MCDNKLPKTVQNLVNCSQIAPEKNTKCDLNSNMADCKNECASTVGCEGIIEKPINLLVNSKQKRCNLISCNKKLCLSARLKCRCGHIFCAQHIYSDEHKCIIDYKQIQQDFLKEAMPKTEFCKLDKI